MSSNITTESQNAGQDKKLRLNSKKRKIQVTLIICAAAFIVYLFIPADHYKRFEEAEIGSSLEQVRKKTGGNYENGVLTVSANKKEIYFYKFEDGKLAEKNHFYLGSGFGSDVNYENFCRADAAMTLSELEEIFGKARLISQSKWSREYLWMESPSQFVVFNDSPDYPKTLLSSLMPNPKQNTEPITPNALGSSGIPFSVEELENKLGAVLTVFKQRLFKDGSYDYAFYAFIENTEYVIFLVPGDYLRVIPSSLENIINSDLVFELHEKMTYSDTVNLFGTEGFLSEKTSEYTSYSWVTRDSDTLIYVSFDQSGYFTEYSTGAALDRAMQLHSPFRPFSLSWDVPVFLRYRIL